MNTVGTSTVAVRQEDFIGIKENEKKREKGEQEEKKSWGGEVEEEEREMTLQPKLRNEPNEILGASI